MNAFSRYSKPIIETLDRHSLKPGIRIMTEMTTMSAIFRFRRAAPHENALTGGLGSLYC